MSPLFLHRLQQIRTPWGVKSTLPLPLDGAQLHTFSGGAYKPEKSVPSIYSTFARQSCNDIHLPGGSLPFQHTHKHLSPLHLFSIPNTNSSLHISSKSLCLTLQKPFLIISNCSCTQSATNFENLFVAQRLNKLKT